MYETIKLTQDGAIATLTFSRPQALNAINPQMFSESLAAVNALVAESHTRALIITGEGKAFVAGADIKAMSQMGPKQAAAFVGIGHKLAHAFEQAPFPVIAAVNGFALGGGCELALAADFIYASELAKFGQPEVNLGVIPGAGGCVRLARAIGPARAKELIYSAAIIDAAKAKDVGLVLEVFPHDTLLEEVYTRARTIASKGPLAVAAAKTVIREGIDADARVASALEITTFANLFDTQDGKAGLKAFVEKTTYAFTGE